MSRTARLLAVAAVAALTLTACGDGTVRAGAAATVGDTRITDSQLNDQVDAGLKDPTAQAALGGDKVSYERSVLSRLIAHQIVTAAAAKEHVTVTATDVEAYRQEVDSQLQQQEQETLSQAALKAGLDASQLTQTLTDEVIKRAIEAKLTAAVVIPDAELKQAYQQNIASYDKVDSAHILVAKKSLADTILATVKAHPSQFAALALKYSLDTGSKTKGGELGFQGKGTFVKPFEDAIFAAKPGSYVEVHSQFGWHVIHVEAHTTVTFDQAKADLRSQLLSSQSATLLATELTTVSKHLGIHVNPRFGVWDATNEEVDAATVCPATAFVSASPRPGDAASPAPTASASANPCS